MYELRFDSTIGPIDARVARAMRLIEVYIVDTDENLPMPDRLIFASKEPILTDQTDEEILHDERIIDLRAVLKQHNATRGKTLNRSILRTHGREVYLDPVNLSDVSVRIIERARF